MNLFLQYFGGRGPRIRTEDQGSRNTNTLFWIENSHRKKEIVSNGKQVFFNSKLVSTEEELFFYDDHLRRRYFSSVDTKLSS